MQTLTIFMRHRCIVNMVIDVWKGSHIVRRWRSMSSIAETTMKETDQKENPNWADNAGHNQTYYRWILSLCTGIVILNANQINCLSALFYWTNHKNRNLAQVDFVYLSITLSNSILKVIGECVCCAIKMVTYIYIYNDGELTACLCHINAFSKLNDSKK